MDYECDMRPDDIVYSLKWQNFSHFYHSSSVLHIFNSEEASSSWGLCPQTPSGHSSPRQARGILAFSRNHKPLIGK